MAHFTFIGATCRPCMAKKTIFGPLSKRSKLKSFSPTAHVSYSYSRPSELPDIRRATSIRMLVSHSPITGLSISDHVRNVICRCAQSLHALEIMRCHGMNSDALKTVYKSVVPPCLPSSSTLLQPGEALQPHQIKVKLKHTYDARFGSTCIKTLIPLRHNLLRTRMTLWSKTF